MAEHELTAGLEVHQQLDTRKLETELETQVHIVSRHFHDTAFNNQHIGALSGHPNGNIPRTRDITNHGAGFQVIRQDNGFHGTGHRDNDIGLAQGRLNVC